MLLSSVVLPEPFGPMRPMISPSATVKLDTVQRPQAAKGLRDIAHGKQGFSFRGAPFIEPQCYRGWRLALRSREQALAQSFGGAD